MAITTTSQMSELLFPGLKEIFGLTYETWDPEYSKVFDIENSVKSFDDYQSYSGFGLVPKKTEAAAVSYDSPIQGFKTTLTNLTYALGFSVSRELFEDDQYGEIRRMPRNLAFSVMQTVETLGADVWNNGFNSSFPGGDGVELFSLVHPLEGGGTASNEPSTAADLSEASVEQMFVDISAFVDGRNLKIKAMPKTLYVHPSDAYEAKKITESDQVPESANNAINPSKGLFPSGVVIGHYLTDSDAWFVRTNLDGIICQKRRFPADLAQDQDFDSESSKFKTSFRLAFGHYDWRGAYGSPGA